VRATRSPPEVHRRAALFHIIAHASCLRGTNIRHATNVMCSTAAALSRIAGKSSRWTSRLFRCVNCVVWLCEHGSSATRGAARLIAVNTTLTLWNAITDLFPLLRPMPSPPRTRPLDPQSPTTAMTLSKRSSLFALPSCEDPVVAVRNGQWNPNRASRLSHVRCTPALCKAVALSLFLLFC